MHFERSFNLLRDKSSSHEAVITNGLSKEQARSRISSSAGSPAWRAFCPAFAG
jgi:hypothetical protein